MALPNDISKIGQIANAVYNSVTANNTAVTALSISNNSVYPSTGGFRRNRIINGSMVIDQRNSGASGTTNGYTIDRWAYYGQQASKGTWGQNLNSVTTLVGYPNYLGFQSSSAYTLLAGDSFAFYQPIEGFNFADLGFGTASAQTVTLSFVVYSSLTGTFGGTLKNFAQTRSYPFTYSIPIANTWTSISVTIPGETSGAWGGSTNAGAAYVQFGLGVGSTLSGTAGAWASASYVSATGAVSVVSTNGATFYVTGIQLEAGSMATPFERLPIGETLMLCQRYYLGYGLTYNLSVGSASTPFGFQSSWLFPVQMRSSPSIVYKDITGNLSCISVYNGNTNHSQGFSGGGISASSQGFSIDANWGYTSTPYGSWCKFLASFSAEL